MRRDEPSPPDPPVAEDLPERETTAGTERSPETAVEQGMEGVERQAPVEPSSDSGVESPPRDADRANLVP